MLPFEVFWKGALHLLGEIEDVVIWEENTC